MPFENPQNLLQGFSDDSSMIVLNVNMWSVVERCGLKPACSSLSVSSMDFLILSSIMLRKIFPGIDSSVTLTY